MSNDLISRSAAIEAVTGWDSEPTDEDLEYALSSLPGIKRERVIYEKWIDARKKLPKESGMYMVGIVDSGRDHFYHISNTYYSDKHRRFNTLDYNDADEVARNGFDNDFCYWMPLPEPPREDAE